MSDQEIHIRIKQQPQLPLILAAPLFMIICGLIAAMFNFIGSNIVELTSFVFVPLIVWLVIGRYLRRTGHPIYALIAVMGSGLVTLTAFQIHAGNQQRQYAADEALRAKIYAENAPKREASFEKSCLEGVPELSKGKYASAVTLDDCARFFTRAETIEICRPLILARAIPQFQWTTCKGFVDEVKSQPQRMR